MSKTAVLPFARGTFYFTGDTVNTSAVPPVVGHKVEVPDGVTPHGKVVLVAVANAKGSDVTVGDVARLFLPYNPAGTVGGAAIGSYEAASSATAGSSGTHPGGVLDSGYANTATWASGDVAWLAIEGNVTMAKNSGNSTALTAGSVVAAGANGKAIVNASLKSIGVVVTNSDNNATTVIVCLKRDLGEAAPTLS